MITFLRAGWALNACIWNLCEHISNNCIIQNKSCIRSGLSITSRQAVSQNRGRYKRNFSFSFRGLRYMLFWVYVMWTPLLSPFQCILGINSSEPVDCGILVFSWKIVLRNLNSSLQQIQAGPHVTERPPGSQTHISSSKYKLVRM
jgi:hypothetical protein